MGLGNEKHHTVPRTSLVSRSVTLAGLLPCSKISLPLSVLRVLGQRSLFTKAACRSRSKVFGLEMSAAGADHPTMIARRPELPTPLEVPRGEWEVVQDPRFARGAATGSLPWLPSFSIMRTLPDFICSSRFGRDSLPRRRVPRSGSPTLHVIASRSGRSRGLRIRSHVCTVRLIRSRSGLTRSFVPKIVSRSFPRSRL